MNKINIAVLYGGCSSEHDISVISASTIISNISQEKYNVIPLHITKDGEWLLYDGMIDDIKNIQWTKFGTKTVISPDKKDGGLLRIVGEKVKTVHIDVVFPVLHGAYGEDGCVQGLLELSGIPYVGCGVLASAVCMDKSFTKIIADSLNVRQAGYLVFDKASLSNPSNPDGLNEAAKKIRYKIGYPCFIKPSSSGSSVGISKATNKTEVLEALEKAMLYSDKIVVEKAVVGREVECAILGSGGDDTEASAVGEIVTDCEFYDYFAKYDNKSKSKTIVPANIPDDISGEIKNIAIKIFKGVCGKGLSRVDFFIEEGTNKIIFNEINTMPGFTQISMYPMLWREAGIETPVLIDRLIELALI